MGEYPLLDGQRQAVMTVDDMSCVEGNNSDAEVKPKSEDHFK